MSIVNERVFKTIVDYLPSIGFATGILFVLVFLGNLFTGSALAIKIKTWAESVYNWFYDIGDICATFIRHILENIYRYVVNV